MVEILNRQRKHRVPARKLEKLLRRLAAHYRLKNPEMVLAFVGTKTITDLNRRFRKKNRPTDVLSFPVGQKTLEGRFYLGDVIISVPQAWKQSMRQKHGLERELFILTIHGFLHLLGFKHFKNIEGEEEKARRLFLGD
jgi:probable rRNA maturation factor